jgi:peroxiredoxin Q/BCP
MSKVELKVGDLAPEFDLLSDTGQRVKLADYRGKRVVLYFYPKDDTKGCTTQACGFRDIYVDIEAHNAVVLGVSPDGVESHQQFKTKFNLPFLLLADEGHVVAERYGVWGQKSLYGHQYEGVIRSHFVIDEAGRLVDVQSPVAPKDSVARALEAIGG